MFEENIRKSWHIAYIVDLILERLQSLGFYFAAHKESRSSEPLNRCSRILYSGQGLTNGLEHVQKLTAKRRLETLRMPLQYLRPVDWMTF